MRVSLALLAVLGISFCSPVLAQEPPVAPPAAERRSGPDLIAGGGFLLGRPVGDFAQNVGTGYGVAGHLVLAIPEGVLGLRIEAAGLIYGSETVLVPVSPRVPRVFDEVTTENWIFGLTLGPEVMLRRGAVRPYAHAQIGFSYFSTTSEVAGEGDLLPFARSTNFDDFTFALRAGGGLPPACGSKTGGSGRGCSSPRRKVSNR